MLNWSLATSIQFLWCSGSEYDEHSCTYERNVILCYPDYLQRETDYSVCWNGEVRLICNFIKT